MTTIGLRERSKAKRRATIERAALALFAERGYDATTVTAIAEAADLSPRTVSLHFPAKVDLVLAPREEAADRLVDLLTRREPSRSVVEVFLDWLEAETTQADPDLLVLRSAAIAANPSLRSLSSPRTVEATLAAGRALAGDLGLPEHHIAVRVAIAAMAGVLAEYEALPPDPVSRAAARDAARAFLSSGTAAVGDGPATR